jgi:hypothetical protein
VSNVTRGEPFVKEPDMPESEQEIRALLAAATADMPPGIDLLRGVQARRSTYRIRPRITLSAAAAAAAAAGVLITLALVQAPPSALAQLTSAVTRTAGQSYHFSATTTRVTLSRGGTAISARTEFSGAFDPSRRVGEETTRSGAQTRFIGSYVYLNVGPARGQPALFGGKSWLRTPSFPLWAPATASGRLRLAAGVLSVAETSPQNLLALLESVSQVNRLGTVSGPGWTGTRYAFSVAFTLGASGRRAPSAHATGTIDVDQQGRVRQLDAAYTVPAIASAPPKQGTVELTFSDFGAPVSVSAPPAREVFMSGNVTIQPGS